MGNGEEATEFICTTHGDELRGWEMLEGKWVPGRGALRGEKKEWDKCNRIINKIYLKIKKAQTNLFTNYYL